MSSYKQTRVDIAEFTARPAEVFGLPLAVDDMSLAHHLGIRNKTLWYLIRDRNTLYETLRIPKRGKSTGFRDLQNPSDRLKDVQRAILVRFLEPIEQPPHVGAYVPGRSCQHTAEQHTNRGIILSMDLTDFFPSVRRSMIKRFFRDCVGYNNKVASLLATLMTYEKKLESGKTLNFVPQGAPTSGLIANLVANYLFDGKIIQMLSKLDAEWIYTRYSDDIDISHPEYQDEKVTQAIVDKVQRAVNREGFRINKGKTRREPYMYQQKVLGMVVNKKVNIPRQEFMRLRSLIHNCYVHGLGSQYKRAGLRSAEELLMHVQGKLAYFGQAIKERALVLKQKFLLAKTEYEKDQKRGRGKEIQF